MQHRCLFFAELKEGIYLHDFPPASRTAQVDGGRSHDPARLCAAGPTNSLPGTHSRTLFCIERKLSCFESMALRDIKYWPPLMSFDCLVAYEAHFELDVYDSGDCSSHVGYRRRRVPNEIQQTNTTHGQQSTITHTNKSVSGGSTINPLNT